MNSTITLPPCGRSRACELLPVVLRTGKAAEDIDLVVPLVEVMALAVLAEVMLGRVPTGSRPVIGSRARAELSPRRALAEVVASQERGDLTGVGGGSGIVRLVRIVGVVSTAPS